MTGEELLELAVRREQEDQRVYGDYLKKTDAQGLRKLLLSLIDQENEHEKGISSILNEYDLSMVFDGDGISKFSADDYLPKSVFSADMNVNDFLNHVIDREETGVRFYSALAGLCGSDELRFTFNNFSFEEQKHKNWAVNRYELELLS